MEYLLKHPAFWLGLFSGLFLALFIKCFRDAGKDNAYASPPGQAEANKMFELLRSGSPIDLDEIYPWAGKKKDRTTPGYQAWQSLAFWLASTYADYNFIDQNVTDFWGLTERCFGKSAAYIKMQALEEIINRSTAYILNDGRLHQKHEKQNRKPLYQMVQQIVDSFDPKVYENCRHDNK